MKFTRKTHLATRRRGKVRGGEGKEGEGTVKRRKGRAECIHQANLVGAT